ncbi:DsbA family oxidoreductase [Ferrimonas sediminicola]|uniref:DsbA family oxidoreductase n=1 Tax=Ferrimonas sediminicola TaxID=2569538 RepID=A0A4V5NV72_9GAMM|nr:DsbA family oxidoreductase [Ferrimonas sediminicola]TKB48322.1 DsbA family oxidoreductase [Ferrimonas sediminicola]
MNHLRIDIVSDVTCPWCIIGYKALEQALAQLQGELAAEIHWQPFEINPHLGAEGEPRAENLKNKYGFTDAQIGQNQLVLNKRANRLGFEMHLERQPNTYNTFDAHRLLHWAELQGRQPSLQQHLFYLYFRDGGNPSDHHALIECAVAAGLDREGAREVLDSKRYGEEVRQAQMRYVRLGITSVPAFVINDEYIISGGQPVETFINDLREIAGHLSAA